MTGPNLIINYPAIGAAVAAGMGFGALWYGPLFGRAWAQGMGFAKDFRPDAKMMRKALLLQAASLLLMSYVLAHTGQVWRPSV